ncbi:glycosyltransferase family 2 protein [Caulobacter sp. 17J80-11]|nr:glycosyltransferase family 2 protein [Caulobacter sp. 17J80-11]MBC6983540.1 glycosyltransferase family 2 protein [Caulobacter sp. 17J80-11]
MNASVPDVLVVVPCLNEAAHLDGLLERLLSDAAVDRCRIVVADGGSTDASRAIVRRFSARDPRVILLDNPARLQSAGVNLAARRFGPGCAWLIRLDAHAGYPPDYCAGLLAAAERTGADSVTVPMRSSGGGAFQRAVAAAQNSLLGAGGSRHRRTGAGGWVDHGHHALMRLDAFAEADGYDESFAANEDAELDVRLTRAGRRIWLEQDLIVTYFPRPRPGALFRQYLAYGEGRARTVLKHRLVPRLRQAAPLAVAPAVLLAAAGAAWGPLATPAALWAGGCLAYGAWLGLRERDAWAAGSGAAAMVMHLGWSLGFWRRLLGLGSAPRRAEARA